MLATCSPGGAPEDIEGGSRDREPAWSIILAIAGGRADVRRRQAHRPLRRRDAETEAREIIARADRESANRRKEAELEIKEMAIQQKAEGERELAKLRQELHERERLLDKRQDALEQQHDQLRKQEKMVESTQRKLTEQIEDTNRRNEELASCSTCSGRRCTH